MAKMKIYEIARSIQQQDKNIKSGELVTLLNENGFEVKGANSNIEDEAIGFLMNYFKKKKAAAKAEPKEEVKAPVKEEPKVEKKEEPKVEKKVEEKKEEPKVEKKPEEKKPEEKKKPDNTTLSPEERAELAAKAQPGRRVRHNAFGPGIIKNYGNGVVTIRFPEFGEKKFVLLDVVRRGLLRFDEE